MPDVCSERWASFFLKQIIMKKVFLLLGLSISLMSCNDYQRQQNQLDAESDGKSILLKAESEKKADIEQAKANYESAKLDALTRVEKAKSESQAILLKAESQAKANRLLNESITAEILEFNKINKWNGKLPTTTLGSQGSIINLK
jgi:regulator of protease activity HflC (stomatin/prohibitin superfamily)